MFPFSGWPPPQQCQPCATPSKKFTHMSIALLVVVYIQFFCYGCCVYMAKNKTACSTTKFSPLLLLLLLPNLPFRYSFVHSSRKAHIYSILLSVFFLGGGSSACATITRLYQRGGGVCTWVRSESALRSFQSTHIHTCYTTYVVVFIKRKH